MSLRISLLVVALIQTACAASRSEQYAGASLSSADVPAATITMEDIYTSSDFAVHCAHQVLIAPAITLRLDQDTTGIQPMDVAKLFSDGQQIGGVSIDPLTHNIWKSLWETGTAKTVITDAAGDLPHVEITWQATQVHTAPQGFRDLSAQVEFKPSADGETAAIRRLACARVP